MKNLVEKVVNASHYVFNRKLVSGKAGNVSARFKDKELDVIAITPTETSLLNVSQENIVLVDLDGNLLSSGNPSSELFLHLEIYKKREDVKGIVHTHSPYATGFSFSNKKIKRLEGFGKIKNQYLNEVRYSKPGSKELADNTAKSLLDNDIVVLKNHGIVSIGSNISDAAALAEFIEESAKTQFITHMLNK
ncbi:class II aldolase/adducin family protein [Methanobacterium alcaliphilum]|uniref:class II aldolase/adducin family protein n=1 Tax=Methanobacterium alcaliphilum TaxID=392018 RepID=UPI00200ADFB9|nr:class II aldolase/adducin family protein [Methanobacterium alcaliphilum]MCK9151125.1 class II aldolase/adducin family protein [Methanobacterium alcaliphilum]